MTVEDRLRLHLADKGATWRNEAPGTYAEWVAPEGLCAVALLPQPLTAASIVDAYVARPSGARLTLVHEGPLSPVALRSAARFGIALLDATTLPALPAPGPALAAPPLVFDAPALVLGVPVADAQAPILLAAPEPEALLPAPPMTPLLPPHEDVPLQVAVEGPAEEPGNVEVETTFDAPAQPPSAPAPAEAVVALIAPAAPAGLVIEGPLPWDPAVPVAEPAPAIQVTAGELAALPWHAHAPIEEHVEVMRGNPRARRHVARPTLAGAPDAGSWGLPWPRPVAATDGLSIADPRIWSAQERVHAMRDELDAARGAASFGAVRPEGSPWLKRIQS